MSIFDAMRASAAIGTVLIGTMLALPALAADCTEEARKQVGDLAVFSKMTGMDNCSTADGRAIYAREVALLKVLNERNKVLGSICPASDARWEYAEKTLQNLTRMFAIASRGCGG
jgi:hypothetical protein